jgi:hypothetical protein
LSQARSLWLGNNDIGLHGLIMISDFLASVRAGSCCRIIASGR